MSCFVLELFLFYLKFKLNRVFWSFYGNLSPVPCALNPVPLALLPTLPVTSV